VKNTASFHPAVDRWFRKHFAAPTEPQARAWPEIQAGRNVLVAAPTGSGKTLAAFLAAIDALICRDRIPTATLRTRRVNHRDA
jgi:ATP-dependent Lhr-like helicase